MIFSHLNVTFKRYLLAAAIFLGSHLLITPHVISSNSHVTREVTVLPVPTAEPTPTPEPQQVNAVQHCEASWYGPGFYGNLTANGEIYSGNTLTAAHKTLPFGTKVRVVDQHTGKSVTVRINDRGPYISGRCLDLSPAAKASLGMAGLALVRLELG
jgi:rare lipoprotein A